MTGPTRPCGRSSGRDRDSRDRTPGTQPSARGDPVATEVVGAEAVRFLEGLLAAYALEGTVVVEQDGIELEVNIDVMTRVLIALAAPRCWRCRTLPVASQRRLVTRLPPPHRCFRLSPAAREALARFTSQLIDEVRSSATDRARADALRRRKVVHDTVAARRRNEPVRRRRPVPASRHRADDEPVVGP